VCFSEKATTEKQVKKAEKAHAGAA